MLAQAYWEPPSDRVAELMRTAAAALLESPTLYDDIDAATLATADPSIAADPLLEAALRSTNRANLHHWAEANIERPGLPVPANLGAETLGIARDIVRRGLDDATLITYRTGQNVAWRHWMDTVFGLTSDPDDLRELLDVSARSIFTFVDDTVAGVRAQMDREREELTGGTHAERLEVVNLILEGAPITSRRASTRLNYELARRHTAAILWTDGTPDEGRLDGAAEAFARAAGGHRPFTVVSGATSLWAWVATDRDPDLAELRAALADLPGVRVALGPTEAGMEGFRRSHLDALATQRLLHRMPPELTIATYDDVQVVALTTQDEERASEFVARILGEFATADAELRETLRVYVHEGFSASRTARALFMHRNTIINRVDRAQAMLPVPLEQNGLEVGLALEIVRWLGAQRPYSATMRPDSTASVTAR